MARKLNRFLLFLLIVLGLYGCGRASEEKSSEKQYTIYYTNIAGTRLEEKSYVPKSDKFDGILAELLEKFETPGYDDVKSALPISVELKNCTMGVDDLQVDLDAAYLGVSNVQQVLLQAALVKTLVQLPGVTKVVFTVDGQPMTDSDGTVVEAMNEDSFIDAKGEGINSYHFITLNLYFPNASGDKIVKEVRNVFYSTNMIVEKLIVEQIIRGPVNENLLPAALPSVKVKNVQIVNNVCIIDLNETFQEVPAGVLPETALYAFVNAICDACDVSGVQFKINGEADVRFRGQVNLDQVFKRKADIIEASESSEALTEIFLDADGMEEASTETVQASLDNADQQETEAKQTSTTVQETETVGEPESQTEVDHSGKGSGVGVDPALVEDNS